MKLRIDKSSSGIVLNGIETHHIPSADELVGNTPSGNINRSTALKTNKNKTLQGLPTKSEALKLIRSENGNN